MSRALACLLVLAGLLAGCASGPARGGPGTVGPGSTLPGTNGAPVPRIAWRPCGGEFECATITVPLDYRRPAGPTIALAAIRLPARDPGARVGAVAVDFGGPGAPGVGGLRRLARRFEGLRARLDVIAVDPRGVGGSAPVRCGPFDGQPVAPAGTPPGADFWTGATEAGRACLAGTGELLSHLSTANSARDLDLVRQGLGDAGLSVYGYSYGTYLGATYANLFPGRLRALVVDGALDLVANAAGAPGSAERPVDVRAGVAAGREDALAGVLDACAAAGPARCAFAGSAEPRARFTDVAAAASRAGTSAALAERISDALETADRLPGLARSLAALAAAAPPSGGAVPASTDTSVPTHSTAFLAVQCTDSVTPGAAPMDVALRAEQAAHPVRLLRGALHRGVRQLARRRPGPLPRPVGRPAASPGPRRQLPLRPADAADRRPGGRGTALGVAPAGGRRGRAHHAGRPEPLCPGRGGGLPARPDAPARRGGRLPG